MPSSRKCPYLFVLILISVGVFFLQVSRHIIGTYYLILFLVDLYFFSNFIILCLIVFFFAKYFIPLSHINSKLLQFLFHIFPFLMLDISGEKKCFLLLVSKKTLVFLPYFIN